MWWNELNRLAKEENVIINYPNALCNSISMYFPVNEVVFCLFLHWNQDIHRFTSSKVVWCKPTMPFISKEFRWYHNNPLHRQISFISKVMSFSNIYWVEIMSKWTNRFDNVKFLQSISMRAGPWIACGAVLISNEYDLLERF